ncbi:conserved hypothetical protein [Burkholderia gladioli]|uniref:hypothetical protein n=1 Tax=Burkholderia gladioli TaxID=28095 RepID=UPI001CAA9FE7|nr:hypothetical protein [Burkholderia gladioli]CAG9205813.1 conserved hypothetical protein [Burkholderia gladioli]
MKEIYALPQPLTGTELVTISQNQGGNWVHCTMPLSMLPAANSSGTAWAANLPTDKPATAGVVWNNNGVLSIS